MQFRMNFILEQILPIYPLYKAELSLQAGMLQADLFLTKQSTTGR